MPTYEYRCTACGYEWEAVHSMKDPPLKKCPTCKKNKAQRQVSLGMGFILKGGGWYADLYSSTSSGGASKANGSKSSSSSGSSSSSKAKGKGKSASGSSSASSVSSGTTAS